MPASKCIFKPGDLMKPTLSDLCYNDPDDAGAHRTKTHVGKPILLCTGITNDLSGFVVFFMFPWGETGRTSYAEVQPL